MSDQELGFEDWIVSTQERRDELADYGKSPLPADVGERHMDIQKAIAAADDAERLLADMDSFVTQFEAQAIMTVRQGNPGLTADDRRKLVKDAVRDVQRLRDGVAVTARTIRSRIYAIQNANRSR